MKEWQTPEFLKRELESAKRALFAARSIREFKAIQHRILYLQEIMNKMKK